MITDNTPYRFVKIVDGWIFKKVSYQIFFEEARVFNLYRSTQEEVRRVVLALNAAYQLGLSDGLVQGKFQPNNGTGIGGSQW